MEKAIREKVEAYVRKNYKWLEKGDLMIDELDTVFKIRNHKDAAPLFLGKEILNG